MSSDHSVGEGGSENMKWGLRNEEKEHVELVRTGTIRQNSDLARRLLSRTVNGVVRGSNDTNLGKKIGMYHIVVLYLLSPRSLFSRRQHPISFRLCNAYISTFSIFSLVFSLFNDPTHLTFNFSRS